MASLSLFFTALLIWAVSLSPSSGHAQSTENTTAAGLVTIHPPVASDFKCSEHARGQQTHPGDALGADCNVVRYNAGPEGRFPTFYEGDGTRNEDWYSWNEPLLAPFDAVIKKVEVNSETNQPGSRGEGRASAVLFERTGASGADHKEPIQVVYAHVRDVQVEEGDTVKAGDPVARIGNNGFSWFPHVHIGAVRGDLLEVLRGDVKPGQVVPLQIRFDLAAMGRLEEAGE